jgi:SagB-type dehydrogenase family enzyme
MNNPGDTFQQQTKYHRNEMSSDALDHSTQPELYKTYPDCKKIQLPKIPSPPTVTLHDTLIKRRSVRRFGQSPLTAESLSYLLWASTGITRKQSGYEFRTAPSAGALYPIETYLSVQNVEGIDQGIYHYAIQDHTLELLEAGDFSVDVARAALDQQMCADAAVVFIWTAIFQRSKWKYKQRAYRYVYLDAGHIAENLALAATALDLASCHIAAIYDDEANEIIDADGAEESTIYMTAIANRP